MRVDVEAVASLAGHILVRWIRLLGGLAVFALGLVLMIRADLGLSSWDVLHDAARRLTPLTFGQAVIVVSVLVVVGSLVLGVRPGPGTLANMILIGVFTDAILASDLAPHFGSAGAIARAAALLGGVAAIAFGTALYIGAELGAGPRDSLMLAVGRKARTSPGRARAGIEVMVLIIGAISGGAVGIGTLAFALLIGPSIDVAFSVLRMDTRL